MGVVIQRQVDAVAAGVLFTRTAGGRHRRRPDDRRVLRAGWRTNWSAGAIDPARCELSRSRAGRDQAGAAAGPARCRCRAPAERASRVRPGPAWPCDSSMPSEARRTSSGRSTLTAASPIVQARPDYDARQCRGHGSRTDLRSYGERQRQRELSRAGLAAALFHRRRAGYYHYFRNLGLRVRRLAPRLAAMDRPLRGHHRRPRRADVLQPHQHPRRAAHGAVRRASCRRVQHVRRRRRDGKAARTRDGLARRARRGSAQAFELVRIAACDDLAVPVPRPPAVARSSGGRCLCRRDLAPSGWPRRRCRARASLFDRFLDIRFQRWKNASLADAAAMVTYVAAAVAARARRLRPRSTHTPAAACAARACRRASRRCELWALSRLMRATPSAAPAVLDEASARRRSCAASERPALRDVSRAFERYLETWGFRSSRELMLTVPAFDERPEPLIDLLRSST